jgi:Flp pilus assembly protein TadD/O-antigen ligase
VTSERPPRGFLWFVLFLVPILPLPSFVPLFFGDPASASAVPPVDLDVSKWAIGGALVSLLAVFLLARAAVHRELPPLRVPRAGAWLAALVAWQALSAIWATNGEVALATAARSAWLLVLYLVVVNLCDDAGALRRASTALVAAAVAISLYGLAQLAGLDFPGLEGGERRLPVSTLGNTNFASEWIVATLPIAATLALGSASRAWRIGFGLIALVLAAHEIATRTRAGPFSLAVAFAIALAWWLWNARGRRAAAIAIGAVLVAGAVGYVATQWSSPSGVVRRETSVALAKMAADHPVVGVGAGNFPFAFPPYRSPVELRLSGLNTRWDDAHDDWMQTLVELGVPGLALFALFVAAAIRDAKRAFEKALAPENVAFAGGLAIAIVAVLVNAVFRSPLHNPAASVAFTFAAAAAARLGPYRPFEIRQARRTTIIMPAIVLLALALFSIRPLVADRWYRMALAAEREAEVATERANQASAAGMTDVATAAAARRAEALERSVSALAQACDRERGNVEYRLLLAKLLARTNRAVEAQARLREVIAVHPNSWEAWNDLGKSLAESGKPDEAESAMKKASSIGPERWDVLFNLGHLYLLEGKRDEAKRHLERALALDPGNTTVLADLEKVRGS